MGIHPAARARKRTNELTFKSTLSTEGEGEGNGYDGAPDAELDDGVSTSLLAKLRTSIPNIFIVDFNLLLSPLAGCSYAGRNTFEADLRCVEIIDRGRVELGHEAQSREGSGSVNNQSPHLLCLHRIRVVDAMRCSRVMVAACSASLNTHRPVIPWLSVLFSGRQRKKQPGEGQETRCRHKGDGEKEILILLRGAKDFRAWDGELRRWTGHTEQKGIERRQASHQILGYHADKGIGFGSILESTCVATCTVQRVATSDINSHTERHLA
ncbi:uncharacterized protein LAESUDRAFT_714077 [Laetiporus sulphureus 93-53]|uniref:Uncharacterized protein n=1 Tax=Laetiporus sulphureus 93-53 TaxID=1314785 RepID=A0A165EAU1_9APHY|nr:uncharacterized protein LAESUDRAFT_714077 [Laetiporus sulphureus 93-53]KZT06616.1 hypothetical protein LAESUDRAFT_714077 [Laetiporus sulphureus 93-53]